MSHIVPKQDYRARQIILNLAQKKTARLARNQKARDIL